jgi:predicted DNA-binding protein (MmcQ/YjbR family)
MHIEEFTAYCAAKKGVTQDFPFDEVTLCVRVMGKIFAITGLDNEQFKVALKCEPDYALELRERHPEVQPGWHMNKTHWNTVDFGGSLDDAMLRHLIDHSYEQVVKTLKKAEREELGEKVRK